MDLQQFLEERRSGIGGSDAAALFNEGRGCRRRLVYEKQGKEPDYPDYRELRWLERGIELEPIAATMFAGKTNTQLRILPVQRLPGYDYLMVHLDRGILDPNRDDVGLLELKTMIREQFYDFKRNGMRAEHQLQMQWGFMVTGMSWGEYGALWPDGWDMIHHGVLPNQELMDACFKEGFIAWEEVQEKRPLPDRLDPSDPRCQACKYRRSCQGEALLALLDGGTKPVQNPDIAGAAQQFVEAKEIAENSAALVDEARKELEAAIGDNLVVETPGYRIYHKPQVRHTVDTKGLKKLYPQIAEQFTKETVSRPLRVYPT